MPVRLMAYPGESVIIQPPVGAGRVMTFVGPQQYIEINGFVMDAINTIYDAVKVTYSGTTVSSTSAAHHIRFVNVEIENGDHQGVLITGQPYASYNEILYSNIHNNGFRAKNLTSEHLHGLYVSTANNCIVHNSIHDNAGYGVHLYEEPAQGVDYNVVAYNRIYHNGVGPTGTCNPSRGIVKANCAAGVIIGSGTGNRFYNNLVYDNQGYGGGVAIDFSAISSEVVNNTVYNNPNLYGVHVGNNTGTSNSLNVVVNNIMYLNMTNPIYAGGSADYANFGAGTNSGYDLTGDGSAVGPNSIVKQNPLFVNASLADFHLSAGSPAIDKGTTVGDITDVFDSVPRPQGTAYDIGAYEYVFSDTTPPTTSIMSPATGATVAGTITISASASDDLTVTKVEFYVDSTLLATSITAPYAASWNTTSFPNGTHSLITKAYDPGGNVGTSASVSVTVNNTDTTPPTTSITSPATGATVSDTITISASASDDVSVTSVEFYVDSTLLATSTNVPYAASWSTRSVSNGTHVLTTRAYDPAGNVGASAGVTVIVHNSHH
jgi:hypothetical protein